MTVFAPGLAASVAETRPFGSGVVGTRVFLEFRGLTYARLASELRRVADGAGATRALGVSLGAGALMALVAQQPDRFERLVLVLPAGLDTPRPDPVVRRLRHAADLAVGLADEHPDGLGPDGLGPDDLDPDDLHADADDLADALLGLQPPAARERPDVVAWSRQRAREIVGTPAVAALRAFADQVPLADRAVLASCRVPVLVLGQEGDDAHPVSVARDVADSLPAAELEVLPPGGLLWSHRAAVRDRIAGFLNPRVDGAAETVPRNS